MTNKREESNDVWITEYVGAERRRNLAYGAVIICGVLMVTAVILYYFATNAAIAW